MGACLLGFGRQPKGKPSGKPDLLRPASFKRALPDVLAVALIGGRHTAYLQLGAAEGLASSPRAHSRGGCGQNRRGRGRRIS